MGGPAGRSGGRRAGGSGDVAGVGDVGRPGAWIRRHLEESRRPVVVLAFLLPGIAFYEIRLALLHLGGEPIVVNKAQHGVFRFLEAIGLGQAGTIGMALPGLVLVVLLLIWQAVVGGSWRVRPATLAGMLLESVLMALPLLALSRLAAAPPLVAAAGPWADLGVSGAIAISLGAGLYEELVFRLLLIAVVHTVLVDMLRVAEPFGSAIAVLTSAIAFAVYHPLAGADGGVDLVRAAFYLVAGIWLGVLMLVRGFGIAVGAHAAYDVATLLAIDA